jgi:excisionase family DNA binding protein
MATPPQDREQMLTPNEVAAILGVSAEAVRLWIRERQIRFTTIGSRYRIPQSEIDRMQQIRGPEPDAGTAQVPTSGDPLTNGVFGEDRPLVIPETLR